MAGERLSTLAKVQIAAFLKYGEWAWNLRGEWRLIASYRRCPTVKGDLDLLDYAKTDAYRLTFEKYNAEESLRLFRTTGEPLRFRYAAPFRLIREACQVKPIVYRPETVHFFKYREVRRSKNEGITLSSIKGNCLLRMQALGFKWLFARRRQSKLLTLLKFYA